MAVVIVAAYGLGRLGKLLSVLRPVLIVVLVVMAIVWITRGAES